MLAAVRARKAVHAGTGDLVVLVKKKKKKQDKVFFFCFITEAKQDYLRTCSFSESLLSCGSVRSRWTGLTDPVCDHRRGEEGCR